MKFVFGSLINFEIWYKIWINFTIKVSFKFDQFLLNLNGRIKIQMKSKI